MKKIILITAVLSLMGTACKKKEQAEPLKLAAERNEINCSENEVMRELNALHDQEEILKWLKDNGEKICAENLYLCIEERHVIPTGDYEKYTGDHPENNPLVKTYYLKWRDISDFIDFNQMACYEKYVGFAFAGGNISLKSLAFTDRETCYSVALLRGIQERHNLTANDSLGFSKGIVLDPGRPGTSNEKVLITVEGPAGNTYYDLSDDPR